MIPVPASLIFIGHFGIVLAAKKILPKVCLDTLARVSVHYRATRQDRPVWILVIHLSRDRVDRFPCRWSAAEYDGACVGWIVNLDYCALGLVG